MLWSEAPRRPLWYGLESRDKAPPSKSYASVSSITNSQILKVVAGAVLSLLLICIYPFQTTVVPGWSLQVIDDQGAHVPGINVTQHWQHNLLESVGHEEIQRTNAEGEVVFPPRTIRASLFSRARALFRKLITEGSDGKFNKYSSVVVWGSKENQTNVAVYEGEGEPPAQVVAARMKSEP